ncbi:MAG: SusD/RagB family nutrient-binding outer membrane lipoprotein [Mediterranea sp.]|jgi:hypothetical protein|nr:SusD/RagB family nutrient-binding outer membrane lipoprotein [Mediterranea sp.]
MKRKKFLYNVWLNITLLGVLASCEGYLDVNKNPNYPDESHVTMGALLPSAFIGSASVMGYQYQLYGGIWAQHYTQNPTSSQYIKLTNYAMTSSSDLRLWRILYADALPDFDLVLKKSEEEKAWNYWVIAKIMTAYCYHILTDSYGDIPFNDALKGTNSKFDDSKTVVYPGLIQMLDDAMKKESEAVAAPKGDLSLEDYIFAADISKWMEFARTLKLKLLMRDFEANKTEIQAMLVAGGLLTNTDATVHCFEDLVNKSSPFYENDRRQLNTINNVRACTTLFNYMNAYSDPRIADFFEKAATPLAGGGEYRAIPYGSRDNNTYSIKTTSLAKIGAVDPVYYLSAAETEYMLAECYARLDDRVNARLHYDKAVILSFQRWSHDATTFISPGGAYAFIDTGTDAMLKCILTQKWIASTRCQAWDTWCDINRTGIPAVGTLTTNDPNYELGTLAYGEASALAKGQYPHRFIYSKESLDYNPLGPDPEKIPAITDPLWWHKQ